MKLKKIVSKVDIVTMRLMLLHYMWKGVLENKRRQFWFCCHTLSGNGQARPYFGVVDAGLAGIHYDTNMDRLTIIRQPMSAKPKLSSFILFLMHLI